MLVDESPSPTSPPPSGLRRNISCCCRCCCCLSVLQPAASYIQPTDCGAEAAQPFPTTSTPQFAFSSASSQALAASQQVEQAAAAFAAAANFQHLQLAAAAATASQFYHPTANCELASAAKRCRLSATVSQPTNNFLAAATLLAAQQQTNALSLSQPQMAASPIRPPPINGSQKTGIGMDGSNNSTANTALRLFGQTTVDPSNLLILSEMARALTLATV
uniref:Uncharacterized protein n=1 Tax=Ditylenchus dipsaci TaxID=166011 RepID=A0A915EBZ5_9BILA